MDGEFVKGASYPGLWVEWPNRCRHRTHPDRLGCTLQRGHTGDHAHLSGPLRGVCNDTWEGDHYHDLRVGQDSGR